MRALPHCPYVVYACSPGSPSHNCGHYSRNVVNDVVLRGQALIIFVEKRCNFFSFYNLLRDRHLRLRLGRRVREIDCLTDSDSVNCNCELRS